MSNQADLFEGRRRRDKVLDEHAERRRDALRQIDRAMRYALEEKGRGTVTADVAMDLLDRLEEIHPEWPKYDRRFLGALWRKPHWVKTGEYVQSRRPERHARPIPVWRYDP